MVNLITEDEHGRIVSFDPIKCECKFIRLEVRNDRNNVVGYECPKCKSHIAVMEGSVNE